MRLFSRNLARCGFDIVIEDRDERFAKGTTEEVFSNPVPLRALVKTLQGVTVFDDTNTEVAATHQISIAAVRAVAIASLSAVGLVATATTDEPHSLTTGTVITVTMSADGAFNVTGVAITVTSLTTFTYPITAAPAAIPAGGAAATYVQDYTAENWVTLKGKRLKILDVENCGEQDSILKLICTERGEDVKRVNRA